MQACTRVRDTHHESCRMQSGYFAPCELGREVKVTPGEIHISIGRVHEQLDLRMPQVKVTQPRNQPAKRE